MSQLPESRLQSVNQKPLHPDGDYVLYWMIAHRRTEWNFALQRAVQWAEELNKPLLVLEALRCGYEWASDRLHRFIIDGMRDNGERLAAAGVAYHPFVETREDEGKGLLAALGSNACVVVTDHYPHFFLPRMVEAAGRQVAVKLEQVDSNGLLPSAASDRVYPTAYSFRRHLQKSLVKHLHAFPDPDPLRGKKLPRLKRLPKVLAECRNHPTHRLLAAKTGALSALPIDHSVSPANESGGARAAQARLRSFVESDLPRYGDARNHPDDDASSRLSPYLHFGHISVHQIFYEIMSREGWTEEKISSKADGRRSGWWGASESVEAFLDQLITWRELGYHRSFHVRGTEGYESLPDWALKTLELHGRDPRPYLYSYDELKAARTHDRLWNAAQNQLVREGRIHNYLRMLWGKKILEWSASPREALEIMFELNNRFALDGRDPNSDSGVFWILGRYDRAWGPERPIFGKVRFMSSRNTAAKVRLRRYLEKYAP